MVCLERNGVDIYADDKISETIIREYGDGEREKIKKKLKAATRPV